MFSPVLSLEFSCIYWTCNSMNNLSSYFGLVVAKIRASDKDLPVSQDPSIIFNFENSSESTFCICFCYFLLRAATRPASPEPGDVAGLQKGSEGWIGLRENNIGKNCINSRNFSIKVQNSEKIKWFKDWSFQKMHYQCGITNIDYVSIQLWPVKVCLIFCFNFKYLCKVCAYLTANTFESGPMPTPWKFVDSPPVIPSC